MDSSLVLASIFVVGVLYQAFLLSHRRIRSRELLKIIRASFRAFVIALVTIALFAILVAVLTIIFRVYEFPELLSGITAFWANLMAPGEIASSLALLVVVLGVMIAFAIALIFERRLLPKINEQQVFFVTLTFGFAVFSQPESSVFLMSITLITIMLAFLSILQPRTLSASWRIMSYIWFLIASVQLLVFQNVFHTFDNFGVIGALILGMALMQLMFYVWTLAQLVPFSTRFITWDERMAYIREHLQLLLSRYSNEQSRVWPAMKMSLLFTGLFLLSFLWPKFVPPGLTMNLAIASLAYFFRSEMIAMQKD